MNLKLLSLSGLFNLLSDVAKTLYLKNPQSETETYYYWVSFQNEIEKEIDYRMNNSDGE